MTVRQLRALLRTLVDDQGISPDSLIVVPLGDGSVSPVAKLGTYSYVATDGRSGALISGDERGVPCLVLRPAKHV